MPKRLYDGEIPALPYRIHPALGFRPATERSSSGDDLPDWWNDLPDDLWESTLKSWLRDLIEALRARGCLHGLRELL